MMRKDKLMAAFIIFAGLLLTAYAVINPSAGMHSSMMGMPLTVASYSLTDMLLAMVGAFAMASGLAYILLKEDYEPLIESAPLTRARLEEPEVQRPPVGRAEEASTVGCSGPPIDSRQLVLRLLTGDERTMFRAILDSGGEALQKDLIVRTKMSEAKVSRVLDRLVEKGVISKVRFGMTNKVRAEIEP